MRWNNDPDVLYFAEGSKVTRRTLHETQSIYRGVSQSAFVFISELDGEPIGECWLQNMNLKRVIDRHPGLCLKRIDLTIGEKRFWGRGWGTKTIRLLTRFGFEEPSTDAIFGCDVADYNPRSRKAFEKNGYTVDAQLIQPPGRKSRRNFDLILTREQYLRGQDA
jgi:RimJ/RimL family protein N-acetyltransferase